MLFDYLPPIAPLTCESPRPTQEHPRQQRRGSVFDRGGETRHPISSKSRAQIMDLAEALERSAKALGQRDRVLGPSTPMVRRGRYRAISSTSRAAASAASSAHNDIVLKYFKHSVSTDCQNPGTILRCGAESLRTTTIKGVIEAQK
jgi:hypothetical protein